MLAGVCCNPTCKWIFPAEGGRGVQVQCPSCGWTSSAPAARDRWARQTRRDAPTPDPKMTAASPQAVNPKTAQGNKKYNLRLLPLPAEVEVNRALEDGMHKYGAANWRITGVPASVYVDAARRHLAQWFDGGQERASDSNVHNLGHAMACLAILLDAQWNNTLSDDRPAPCRDTDALLKR